NIFLSYDNELRRAQQQLEKRQATAYEKRVQLLAFIGLPSSLAINLPTQMPGLPAEDLEHPVLLGQAKEHRAEIKIARQQLGLIDERLQLASKENGWRDMRFGINAEREFDSTVNYGAVNYGPEMEFSVPVFNRGQGKIATI